MKRAEDTSRPGKRYVGLDVRQDYITVGGMQKVGVETLWV